jgi:hypothetical protein
MIVRILYLPADYICFHTEFVLYLMLFLLGGISRFWLSNLVPLVYLLPNIKKNIGFLIFLIMSVPYEGCPEIRRADYIR